MIMNHSTAGFLWFGFALGVFSQIQGATPSSPASLRLELAGITVTPQARAQGLRYGTEPNNELGARVELFMRNPAPAGDGTNATFFSNAVLFDDKEPQRLIREGDWAWHDSPSVWAEAEVAVPPQGLVVWSFNTKTIEWGMGKKFTVTITDWQHIKRVTLPLQLAPQGVWLSAVAFLSSDGNALPDTLVFHVANQAVIPVKIVSSSLYLPQTNHHWRINFPLETWTNFYTFPANGIIPPGDKGGGRISTGRLPLSRAALQVVLADNQGRVFPLWARTRIKREWFDISGGRVQDSGVDFNTLTNTAYLKTLKRLHVTTAHMDDVPGYTDQTGPEGRFTLYPLKRFGKLEPTTQNEADGMLRLVHAVDVVGKPQFEFGGVPRFPQAVQQTLLSYAKTRLTTTVTLTDESTWRYYAGLADFPNIEVFRLCAPAMDDWTLYDRWEGKPIGWGAPLETLGELTRTIRELSRPMSIACWAQGPYYGWEVLDGRKRTAPTADELRVLAYHALSSHVMSLYWHNLSLRSLVQFRDTLNEMGRIGREIKMLEDFYLSGDAYRYQQVMREGKPDWDLASIVSPRGALLFALDLDYTPDRSARVFEFKRRREAVFVFDLPAYLRRPAEVYRVDADGIYPVNFSLTEKGVQIADKQNKVAIYVATSFPEMRNLIEGQRQLLLNEEQSYNFDPANKNRDFELLKAGLGPGASR